MRPNFDISEPEWIVQRRAKREAIYIGCLYAYGLTLAVIRVTMWIAS